MTTTEFTELFADVTPLDLRRHIVTATPMIAELDGEPLERVRRIVRANSTGLRMLTPFMAVRRLQKARPDLSAQLEDDLARNWVRGELDALRRLL